MITLTLILAVTFSLFWGLGVLIQLLGTWVSLWPSESGQSFSHETSWEPISILKPLKGCDAGLEENLKTFFELNYPEYEILFSLENQQDAAHPVVQRLFEQYPQVKAQLVVEPVNLGPNPKVNNMYSAYQLAKNDLILISDSNVRVDSDYLKTLSSYVRDPNVGMVTAVISGIEAQGIGGRLEAVFLNTFYSRWMRLLFFVGRPCVVGKSMLFRKSTARRFGGMNVLARYLAEDFMAGEAIRRLGMKVVLANEPVSQWIGSLKLRDFWSRHIRWGRIRKSQGFLAFMVEPVLGSVACSLMGSLAFYGLAKINPFNFFVGQMILWFLLEIPVIVKSRNPVSFSVAVFWFVRELLAIPLWFNIAMGNSVQWRGRKLKLVGGGLLESEETNEFKSITNIVSAP